MGTKRRTQFALILTVAALTLYNILPTLLFYAKPLGRPVTSEMALQTGAEIAGRVDGLEQESIEWLGSYCDLLQVRPLSIASDAKTPHLIHIRFAKSDDAKKLRTFLPRAGALIPFLPAELTPLTSSENEREVVVQRKLGVRLAQHKELFQYIPKFEGEKISPQYRAFVQKRLDAVVQSLATFSPGASPASVLEIAALHPNHPKLAARLAARLASKVEAKQLEAEFASQRDALKLAKNGEDTAPQELQLAAAEAFLKKHPGLFATKSQGSPFFEEMTIDWVHNQIVLHLHPDCVRLQAAEQLLIDEVAHIARVTDERVVQTAEGYVIALQEMSDMTGILSLNLERLAEAQAEALLGAIQSEWHPTHPDLASLPIVSSHAYSALSPREQALCLVASEGLITIKGIGHLLRAYEATPHSPEATSFLADFRALTELLARCEFFGGLSPNEDFVFERQNPFAQLLLATRENFKPLHAVKRAVLELSDVQQRIIAVNKIETSLHEELLKWHDEYRAAQVHLHEAARFDVPKPTRSAIWSNLSLTMRKLWRGDERKILRWGLDLSGGKSVQIELRDQNNKLVSDPSNLKQGINELFNRVNKMGVSDVSIRQVGDGISIDFPGSQAFSASDLIQASSMSFHIVNEKFGPSNGSLAAATERFLQEVWNTAVVLRTQDPDRIEDIARERLYSKTPSDAAKTLRENGLALTHSRDSVASTELEESGSKVLLYRDAAQEMRRKGHPLLIVFHNHVLEGSHLDNIQSHYDASKGNSLSFEVNAKEARSALFAWTSLFSKENILGTARETYAPGRGWRMAVVLNGSVISAPTLESPLERSASISGSFSQREINRLISDLKAGALSFIPKILSEKNISPELGTSDRTQAIWATFIALLLVIGSMLVYYRFAGLIASIAVLFNLLILWAILQNLGASLSLAGIAGIILTVGMAVDANVLVFERMKEEFAVSGRISSAIKAGYEKAFSAIVDSNITTIIAAIILLNFDSGPIKAFAITMIIGIASSMFTALFLTRFYFNEWLRNPRNTTLSMAHWIGSTHFDFLKRIKIPFLATGAIIVIGGCLLISQRSSIFGLDFTGGYALTVELNEKASIAHIEQALVKQGADSRDFQIRQHSPEGQFQILIGTSMEMAGKPFARFNAGATEERIDWVITALEKGGLPLSVASKQMLNSHFTAVSGQMSDSMRNNALIGLLLAIIAIFIYIAFRFEYKSASAALLCLLHDVLITLGCIGLLHACKVPIQIDLNAIAALMMIIGYSLNDTIIIFDRVREEIRLHGNRPMRTILNSALNTTLSRTTITSGTTLLVLLALLFLGGASIFNFSLIMVVGIIFGTFSSWFIATPLLLMLHNRQEAGIHVSDT